MVSTSNYPNTLSDYNNGSQPETSQEYAIPPDLFIISDTTDKQVEADVMDPVLKNLFDKSKNAFIRFHINKLVNNSRLRTSFESYKRKLQFEGKNPQEVYGFIQLPNGDHGEEEELCAFGVRVGMNYRGELADASKGVYLSRFADTCTPCHFVNDQCLRILICKVLLGKTRKVKPSAENTNSNISPDPAHNSYIALTADVIKPETSTPHERYINSLIYIYEYIDKDTTSDRPASILPISVAEVQCNKPGPDFLNIQVPRNNNSVIWTGTLQLQRYMLKHVTMHSHFASVGRPRGMDILQFKITVPYDTVVNCMPLVRLLEPKMIGALLQQPEVAFDDQQTPTYIQYFVLQSPDCEDFDNLCTLMRKFELVGVNKLPSGTHLYLIPNGGLSMKLGLCLFNTSSFHCISVSTRPSIQANINWQQDMFVNKSIEPPQNSIITTNMLFSKFRRTAPIVPVIPHNIVPPMNFSVPPPNFSFPPPRIQSPSIPKFFTAQPLSHKRLSSSSTGSNDNLNFESNLGPSNIQRMQRIFTRPPVMRPPLPSNKIDATPNQMDRLLNELPKKPSNTLDPRLSANKGHDPRRQASSTQYANTQTQNNGKNQANESPKLDFQSLSNNGQRYDSTKNENQTERRRRSPSFDDRLEIVEDPVSFTKPPEDPINSRKRSGNFGANEDIDLREPMPSQSNGQSASRATLPPPKLINLPANVNLSGSSFCQVRPSRFGAHVANVQSPSLVNPTKLNAKQSIVPPPLFPPKHLNSDVMPTAHNQIVVVPDPELIISPVLNPDQLLQIFQLAQSNNERTDNPRILFKWHACINEELKKQITDAPANSLLANRAQKIKNILIEYIDLVESVNPHLCDKGARTAQKSLICAMNIKRLHENSQLVFLSVAVTAESPHALNFSSNEINLKSPEQFIEMIKNA